MSRASARPRSSATAARSCSPTTAPPAATPPPYPSRDAARRPPASNPGGDGRKRCAPCTACATLARRIRRRADMILPRYHIAASAIAGAGKGLFLDEAVAAGRILTAPDGIEQTYRQADIEASDALQIGRASCRERE